MVGARVGEIQILLLGEAANNHLLVVSLMIFAVLAFEDGCEVLKAVKRPQMSLTTATRLLILEALSTHELGNNLTVSLTLVSGEIVISASKMCIFP